MISPNYFFSFLLNKFVKTSTNPNNAIQILAISIYSFFSVKLNTIIITPAQNIITDAINFNILFLFITPISPLSFINVTYFPFYYSNFIVYISAIRQIFNCIFILLFYISFLIFSRRPSYKGAC